MITDNLRHSFNNLLASDKAWAVTLLMVSVLYVVVRLFTPLKFDGSYIDEYWHITSGISLIETGEFAYFYTDIGGYSRGMLMSLYVGLLVSLFGKSIYIAKLAPVSIAIINYCLVLYLSGKLFEKRRFQLLLLVLYMVSPWLLFEHSYIRFYIVNELYLLSLLVLGYKLYDAMKSGDWVRIFVYFSLIAALNALNLLTTNDPSKFMLVAASATLLSFLFIYEYDATSLKDGGLVARIARHRLLSTRVNRTIIVAGVVIIGSIILDAGNKMDFLLNGSLPFTSPDERKYGWLFWSNNSIISIFFVFAVTTFWWRNNAYERVILPVAGVLFLIHIASSKDLQIIRGILYFIPLYYIAATIGVSKLFRLLSMKVSTEWLSYTIISFIFIGLTVTNVEKSFYWGPRIKREVNYIEYASLYKAVDENCKGRLIIEASPSAPFVAAFYGIDVDYALSATGVTVDDTLYTRDLVTGKFKTVWGDLPVLTDIGALKFLDSDICLIVRKPSKARFVSLEFESWLQKESKSWNYHNIDLYLVSKDKISNMQIR